MAIAWVGCLIVQLQGSPRKLFWHHGDLKVSGIRESSGKGYRFKLPAEQAAATSLAERVRVQEGSTVLPFQVGSIAEVVAMGGGAWCLTEKNLWFSASDDSDPRTNGRRYRIGWPVTVPASLHAWTGYGGVCLPGLMLVVLLGAHRGRIARCLRDAANRTGSWLEWLKEEVRKHTLFYLCLGSLIAARMLLVSHDEIVACGSDSENYINLGDRWFYGAHPNWYIRVPVYPLFISLCRATGLPLRLLIEVAQIGCYALFCEGCRRCGCRRWTLLLVFGALLLAPQTAYWNNFTLADTLYGPMLLAASGLGLWLATAPSASMALAFGVMLGLTANVREEGTLMILPLALIIFLVLAWPTVRRWFRGGTVAGACGGAASLFRPALALLAGGLVTDLGFQAAYWLRTGVLARSHLSTPGMAALMDSLYRIPVDGVRPPQVLVDRRARERAYAISGTLRTQRDVYESSSWRRPVDVGGERIMELAADGLVWTSLKAFPPSGPDPHVAAQAWMRKTADEIKRGLAGHAQQRIYRGGSFPFNDAAVEVLKKSGLSLLWQAIVVTTEQPPEFVGAWSPTLPLADLFNRVANRRLHLAQKVDEIGDTRPPWIKSAWRLVHLARTIAMWTGGACLGAGLFLVVFSRHGWSVPSPEVLQRWLPLVVLAGIVATRLTLATLIGIYFDIASRYVLPASLAIVPLAVLGIDVLATQVRAARATPQVAS